MADDATLTATSTTDTATTDATTADAAVDTSATALGGADAAGTDAATTDATADDATKGADDTPQIPEAYELKGTDGDLDPVALEAATPVFKELGLNNEQAQKLIPVAEQFAKSISDKLNQQILDGVATQRKGWLDEAKADAEIGGQNWDSTLVTAAKALDQLGAAKGSPFRALLDDSGLGNHPEMIRMFAKVGKAIGEDTAFPRSGAATSEPKSLAERLYPNAT